MTAFATEYPYHIHISEREPDGTWEDCTFDGGLEWYRDCIDPTRPSTHVEAQKIRNASGKPPTGGANLQDFRRGVQARYGKVLVNPIATTNILTALKPGMAAVVQGSMSAFGPGHHLSKWDRNFDGTHAVYIARRMDNTLRWCDPEAPLGIGYRGTAVTEAEVTAFVKAFPAGQALVAKVIVPAPPPPDPKLYSQAELDAAVEAATAPLEALLNQIHDLSNLA